MAARTPTRGDAQTLREVIRRLGPSLITVAAAPDGSLDRSLAGVCVHDPLLEVEQGRRRVRPPSCCTSTAPCQSKSQSRHGVAAW